MARLPQPRPWHAPGCDKTAHQEPVLDPAAPAVRGTGEHMTLARRKDRALAWNPSHTEFLFAEPLNLSNLIRRAFTWMDAMIGCAGRQTRPAHPTTCPSSKLGQMEHRKTPTRPHISKDCAHYPHRKPSSSGNTKHLAHDEAVSPILGQELVKSCLRGPPLTAVLSLGLVGGIRVCESRRGLEHGDADAAPLSTSLILH